MYSRSSSPKLNAKEKRVIEDYKLNNTPMSHAYMKGKGVTMTDENKDAINKEAKMFFALPKVMDYMIEIDRDLASKFEIKKEDIVTELIDIVKTYQFLIDIAMKDTLTKEENEKFNRLKSIIGTKDKIKALETIAKLMGFMEETNNIQVNVFKANFGGEQNDEDL